MEETSFSLIHPDLMRETFKRKGLEDIEVTEEGKFNIPKDGLKARAVFAKLVGEVLAFDVWQQMVCPSNAEALRKLINLVKSLDESGMHPQERAELVQFIVDELEEVAGNLKIDA